MNQKFGELTAHSVQCAYKRGSGKVGRVTTDREIPEGYSVRSDTKYLIGKVLPQCSLQLTYNSECIQLFLFRKKVRKTIF